MTSLPTEISVNTIIPIFTAIGDRHWQTFKDLEADFISQHGVEVWQEVFNFRVLPALDKDSSRWLLIQWCGEGIIWEKNVR
ncbi:hypothetical protein NIES2100_24610 [Calothrix sp. NIES-2100]|uniref:hypothetical protein n=1 Tax=Calothrix sp. NIES-2100 TaxID=1954172 RepID=UPI000B5DC539|nr:hypothetical protein NIES2100_24610 [Calothrix sp. NIES-2100]